MDRKERISRTADDIAGMLSTQFGVKNATHDPRKDQDFSARVLVTFNAGTVYALKITEWAGPAEAKVTDASQD